MRVLAVTLVSCGLLAGCGSVREELAGTLAVSKRPGAPEPRPQPSRSIAVPDLEERNPDGQLLAKIDRLDRELAESRQRIQQLEAEIAKANDEARAARESEARIAGDVARLQRLLDTAQASEAELREKLLYAQIETVRARQEIKRARIRDLTRQVSK